LMVTQYSSCIFCICCSVITSVVRTLHIDSSVFDVVCLYFCILTYFVLRQYRLSLFSLSAICTYLLLIVFIGLTVNVVCRLSMLEKSNDELPYSLVLLEKKLGEETCQLIGHSRICKVFSEPHAGFVESGDYC
jgi:hypothetical protein